MTELYDEAKKAGKEGEYYFWKSNMFKTKEQLVDFWADLAANYPIISPRRRHGGGRHGRLEAADRRVWAAKSSLSATTSSSPTPRAVEQGIK